MTFVFVPEDLDIAVRLAAIGHRPEHGIGVVGVDVLVNRNDPLAFSPAQRCDAIERTPNLSARHVARELDDDQLVEGGKRLMGRNMDDALNPQVIAQVLKLGGLVGGPLDGARFGRCDLADPRRDHRVSTPGDRSDVDIAVVLLQVHMAMAFAEGRLGF